jgi:hypothetical protein
MPITIMKNFVRSLASKFRISHSHTGIQATRSRHIRDRRRLLVSEILEDRRLLAPLIGAYSIGPTGAYASVGAAIASAQTEGFGGAVTFELESSYLSSVETFPLAFTNLGTSSINTLTLRPASGATNLLITSGSATTLNLNGAKFVTIDGRAGGTGTAKNLTIANTSTTGVALQFINDASSNTVQYVTASGVNTSATSGVILFGTTTGTTGNDNNTIDNSDIRDGATTPANGIYSAGSTTTTTLNNSGNTVSNSNLFNFYTTVQNNASGVQLGAGNTDWTISGNSFYQTASRAGTVSTNVRPIYINTTAGNNFVITNNFIGGDSPTASVTTQKWTATGTTFANNFRGIHLNVGATTASSVQGNTIRNMDWSTASNTFIAPGGWSGIYAESGAVNIGTVSGNTIGSGTGNDSNTYASSNYSSLIGISGNGAGPISISNNTIGSLTTNAPSGKSNAVFGIRVDRGTVTINNNTIGSTSTANSLNAVTANTDPSNGQSAGGIVVSTVSGAVPAATVTNNIVANINNNATSTAQGTNGTFNGNQVVGIGISSGGTVIANANTVRNLSSASTNTNSGGFLTSAVLGIGVSGGAAGQSVSQNTVHSLTSTAATAAVSVTGLYYLGPNAGTNVIARNFVHSLAMATTSSSAFLNGIYLHNGVFNAQNNMVRVGLDAGGSSTAGAATVRGIYDGFNTAGRNVYFNSVYVGGTQSSTANNSFALTSDNQSARDFRNNIFVNARSNSGGTGKHYAVSYATNPGLTSNNNIYYTSGTGGVLGRFNNIDRTTLSAWQAAVGQDGASGYGDPLFISATGTAATVDLHLQASNPAEGGGVLIAAVTDDFDGQTRSTLTPTDIGADAGAFTLSSDIVPPSLTYTPLTFTTSTANRELTNFVTATDNVAISSGANAPRLYFKKASDNDAFVGNTSADNGWKYVTPSNGSSPFSFTIDYSLLSGGNAVGGDVIQYFVAVQDDGNNLVSNPTGATASTNPAIQNINAKPTTVNSYNILPLPTGTRTVGPTGDYFSITQAISVIQSNPLTGPVIIELQPSYVSTVESFPLNFTNLGTSATNTLTIRPQTGATNLSIAATSTSSTLPAVDLNNAQYVTFDGRPGGVGTSKQLTISNASTAISQQSSAVRFINESNNNALRYLTLRAPVRNLSSGVVHFGTTNGPNGNDNNTIDNCDIREFGSLINQRPYNAVYSTGTIATLAQYNSGNSITNSNIFNYATDTFNGDSNGVFLANGNTDWTVTGNSLYQTISIPTVGATMRGVYAVSALGGSFTISNNYIGGDSPLASVTTQKWTTLNTEAFKFVGIDVGVGTASPSSIQGNVIRNFAWSAGGVVETVGTWNGIRVGSGSVNVGTVTGNTIGDPTSTGSITTSTSGIGMISGIASISTGTVNISNNTIGSMTTTNTSTSSVGSIIGIIVTNGTTTVSNNTIGSLTTANSLNASNASVNTSPSQSVTGISSSSSIGSTITNNTIANLNNNGTGQFGSGSGQMIGVAVTNGTNTITGNTVRNLSSSSQLNSGFSQQTVVGVSSVTFSLSGQNISQNTIHSLMSSAATSAVQVSGIYYVGAASGDSTISRNLIHSLGVASSSASSVLSGIIVETGNVTVQNNMVRIGLDANGNSTANAANVNGIYELGSTGALKVYHNSVYVGGNETSGNANSFGLNASGGVTNVRNFQNNIFFNARGNAGGTGKHYAVQYGGTAPNPTGLTASNNIYFANSSASVLGRYNNADVANLIAWQAATGQDAASSVADPRFVNATGNATTFDLHLQATNPAESQGILIASVTGDFDGETRNSFTPVDIGADAGLFTFVDGMGPILTGNLQLSHTSSTANRDLTDFALITDASGISTGANAPRIYFKKSTDADVFGVANDSTGNGWKFVTTTSSASPFSFTIDYSLLTGGGVNLGDTIQYFFVSQDDNNNLGSSPVGGYTASANPPVQNINGHGTVYSYSVLPSLSGTKTVGVGGDYLNLTGASGLFAAINAGIVSDNLTINMISDLTETGAVSLNQWSEEGVGNYTLTIQPDSATMRTISGNAANGMINFNGADRVTIDGRFGGSGQFLTFRNTNNTSTSANSTIQFLNDSSNNTVRNSIIEGASQSFTLGVVAFSTGTTTGNDNNLVTENKIRDISTAAGVPSVLIGSSGTSTTVANSGNVLSNNELFNFTTSGARIASTGNETWTFSGNTIYQTAARSTALRGIDLNGQGSQSIVGNTIRDLGTSSTVVGIYLGSGSAASVSRNRIYNFPSTSGSTQTIQGIYIQGFTTTTIDNNQISIIPSFTNNQSIEAISSDSSSVNTVNLYYNSVVVGGTATGAQSTWAMRRRAEAAFNVRNNIFFNFRTGGTGNHFAAGNEAFTSFGGPYTSDYNIYSGTGATAANFMDYSANRTTVPVSFATWRTSINGGDANSQASNPGGNFSIAMFVNAAAGDLHLVPGGNVLVNNAGTPVAGVTTDFDSETRSATTPTIGSDELPTGPNAAPTAVILTPTSSSLAENVNTASAIVLSSIAITDDGQGTNTLSLSGTDASFFEIVGNQLRLKAGTVLDFEAKTSYLVRVNVDDTTVGGTPDAFADFTLNITDIADAPSLTSVVVNGGDTFALAAQRSQITSLVVTFSVPVALGVNPFSIVNNGLLTAQSPVAIDPSQILVTGSGTTYTIRFGAGPGVVARDTSAGLGRGNSLAEGNFLLTIDPSKVTDVAAIQTLTPTNSFGDGDNEFGDRAVDNFFRFFGDADGNGVVNSVDTGAFSRALTAYNAAVDFDGNGSVSNAGVDRTNYLGNFNKRRRGF